MITVTGRAARGQPADRTVLRTGPRRSALTSSSAPPRSDATPVGPRRYPATGWHIRLRRQPVLRVTEGAACSAKGIVYSSGAMRAAERGGTQDRDAVVVAQTRNRYDDVVDWGAVPHGRKVDAYEHLSGPARVDRASQPLGHQTFVFDKAPPRPSLTRCHALKPRWGLRSPWVATASDEFPLPGAIQETYP